MRRRYIGIESGDHIITHCVERLKKVIGGEQGGVTRITSWTGGGGFGFFRLLTTPSSSGADLFRESV
jgi:adenine-specific DNA-methyltransferase